MDLNIIKLYQWFLERSHAVSIKLKAKLRPRLAPIQTKQTLRSSRQKNLQNQNNENFFRNYNAIYRIKCNVDNKTQNILNMNNVIKTNWK